MSILSDIGGGISDLGDDIFGSGSKPGIAGTGQERFSPYAINANAAQTQNGAALNQQAQSRLAQTDQRQAPQMRAASLAPNERVQHQQLAPLSSAQAANTGNAAQMQGAQIARDDTQSRGMQQTLNNQLALQAQGQGPSLASLQLQDAQDRNAKQAMGLAASMPGQGNSALAQRNAMNSVAQSNQDAAGTAAEARITEQNNARAALANNLGTTRGQDIGVNTTQAQLNQDASGQNMGAQNQFSLANSGYQQQANLANAQAANERNLNQANLNYQTQAFNAGQTNNTNLSSAQLQQQANQQNQSAQLQNQAQGDAMSQYYFGTQLGMDQSDRQAQMQMQGMQANQNLGVMGLQAGAYNSAATRQGSAFGGILSGGASLLGAVSDENEKINIQPLNQAYDLMPTESSPGKTSSSKDPMADAMKKVGGSKGGSPDMGSMIGGEAAGIGTNLGNTLDGSMLGSILHRGSSPGADPIGSPTGDMKMTASGGLNPQASMAAINQSTVIGPTQHPGADPMNGSSGGFGIGPLRISDRNQKDGIRSIDDAASNDLRKLTPYQYEYKNPDMPGAGEGKHVSPMAQDLERTKLFSGAVSEDDHGVKRVDYAKAFGGMLAGMAMQNRRLDSLEKRKG